MRCKTFLVALLVPALPAQAARVSESEAAGAASVWAGAGEALGARLGANVESVREHVVANGYSFYAVKLGGGTVIMTSDTELEPVVAFSSSGDIDLSGGSPLLDLLRRDVAARAALAGMSARRSAAMSASSASAPVSSASSLWSALLRRRSASMRSSPSPSLSTSESAPPLESISDVRVAPLVKSRWSQGNAQEQRCYNYYTPSNYVCGCTATAMSQIMRYNKWPQSAVEPCTCECVVDGTTTNLITMQGGTYDWENMTLVPAKESLAEANCQAIGKLTSDVGIALKSSYSDRGTNAYIKDVPAALRDVFGYPDAICYWNAEEFEAGAYNDNPDAFGLHDHALRERVVLANLDARQPVQLAIYGYAAGHVYDKAYWAGHSVVADGYGYQTVDGVETEFVHINMGWAGIDDVWYNIPEVDAANTGAHPDDSGYTFLFLGGAVFNISTNDTGRSILSGRLTDEVGEAVEGATVSVYGADDAKVAETLSDENGIYFFKLPGDAAYLVKAVSADGTLMADVTVDNLPATKDVNSRYCVWSEDDVGNSWGNDMVLAQEEPARPQPVEFTAISEAGGTWALVVTTAVEKCWYSLYETNSLSGGFEIDGVDPVTIRQATADGEMTFERPANGSQLFWKVRAEPEDAHRGNCP